MKIQKDVASLLVLVSAGTMIGLSSNTVHAATNDQNSTSEQADYPKLGAAEDAPTAPESDEANYPKLAPAEDAPKAPERQSQTLKVQQPSQKQATTLRTQRSEQTSGNQVAQNQKPVTQLKVAQGSTSVKKQSVSAKTKTKAPKATVNKSSKKNTVKKASKHTKKVLKSTTKKNKIAKKSNYVELKSAIAGSVIVLATTATKLAVKKIKK